MKNFCKKLANVLKTIFGYGIMICLFGGGLTFFGYLVALIIGGDVASLICDIMYTKIIPVVIYLSVAMVMLGLVVMYLNGEVALTPEKKKARKHEGEV